MDLESCCEELLLAQHIFSSNFNNQITKILGSFFIFLEFLVEKFMTRKEKLDNWSNV